MTSSSEWLDSYQQDVGNLAQRAEEAKAKLQQVASTLTSADGAVTVTVNASGALQELKFGAKADDLPRTQLASAVVATARRAQAQAAQQVTAVMAPMIGTDSDAMQFLQEQIPELVEPEEGPEESNPQDQILLNEEEAEQHRTEPPPGKQPPRHRSRTDDDGDDGGFGSIFD
ncbi:MAG: YbaB/EbfC family nucleoid-associated protein [Sciscionella sp.]